MHPSCCSLQSKQEIHRRSARLRNTKYKSAPAAEKKVSTKGKGRRHIFKLKNVRRCVAERRAEGGPGGVGREAGHGNSALASSHRILGMKIRLLL